MHPAKEKQIVYEPATATAGAGIFLSLIGGIGQSVAAKEAGKANERIAFEEASLAEEEAQIESGRIKDRARRIIAANEARSAASGVTGKGSPRHVMGDSFLQAFKDEIAIERTGRSRARGFRLRGSLARSRGKSRFVGGLLSTFGRAGAAASKIDFGEF